MRRSQKCKKDSQVKQLFALSGPVCLKAAHKHVHEIDPWCALCLNFNIPSNLYTTITLRTQKYSSGCC